MQQLKDSPTPHPAHRETPASECLGKEFSRPENWDHTPESPGNGDQETDRQQRETRIKTVVATFNCHTTEPGEKMPTAKSCISGEIQRETDADGKPNTVTATTNLFLGQWLESKVHGADVVFAMEPMLPELLDEDEKVTEISSIQFRAPITHNQTIRLTMEQPPKTDKKPTITGTFKTSKERTFYLTAYPTETQITRREISNPFATKICSKPFAEGIVLDKKNPLETEIELDTPDEDNQRAFEKAYHHSPISTLLTTVMDIAITGATAIAQAGHIENNNPIGGGFQDLKIDNENLPKISKGAIFKITEIEKPTNTGKSKKFPVHFELKTADNKQIASGTFNWMSMK